MLGEMTASQTVREVRTTGGPDLVLSPPVADIANTTSWLTLDRHDCKVWGVNKATTRRTDRWPSS